MVHPETGEILVDRNEEITGAIAQQITDAGLTEVQVRSPLTCEAHRGVCQKCYGNLAATGLEVAVGQAVGIIAAQSIGEPGTQLTMRTFHTGGVAGLDITSGLPRVEELFEARVPKGAAILADIDGVVEIQSDEEGRRLRMFSREEFREDYPLPENAQLLVDADEYVEPGMVLATLAPTASGEDGASEEVPQPIEQVVANIGGRVELSPDGISIVWEDVEEREHLIPASAHILVNAGDEVKAGDALTGGPLNPHDILHIRGGVELQRYLVDEVQQVYLSQGVSIHDKHIEIILRQMLRRVQVESTGDSDFIPGQMVDRFEFQEKNAKVLAEGGEPATAKPVFLGVTRASLLTDSFLSAASFQETTRVLTQAAVSGAQDWLLGLKENVIIGRLIPARLQIPGLDKLLGQEPVPEVATMVPGGWLGIAETPEALSLEAATKEFPDIDLFDSGDDDDLDEDAGNLLTENDDLFASEVDGGNGVAAGGLVGHGDGRGQDPDGNAPVNLETEDEVTSISVGTDGEIDGGDSPPQDLLTEDGTEE